jgi:molybdopterin/thiamine biosynthesis adenylyltransferase
MPELVAPLDTRYNLAIAQINRMLGKQGRRLAARELAMYRGREYSDGWRLKTDLPGYDRELNLLVRRELPFAPPAIALVHPPPSLTWPHVEEDGHLCLLPELASISHDDASGVARWLIRNGYSLIEDSVQGRTRDDFLHEFLSYWNRGLGTNTLEFVSLIEPKGPSRLISFWAGKVMYVFGEEEASVQKWLRNRYDKDQRSFKTERGAFLWLDRPLYPNEYPKSARDVWAIANERTDGDTVLLSSLAEESPNRITIIFGAQTENGPCLAGVTVSAPQRISSGGNMVSPLKDGFRPDMLPPVLVSNRYWQSGAAVRRSAVDRADAAWIHGRGMDPRQSLLAAKTVALIGCGSVGAHVAVFLVMAGVGRVILIDKDVLKRANIGRHPLGAKYVGRSKAIGLAEKLKEDYPHIEVIAKFDIWERIARLEPELLESCDLIIGATGDWGADSALNEWRQGLDRDLPVLYGWTEAHACAGHAVLICGSGCFECGFDNMGQSRFEVTAWRNQTKGQEPACGSVYQPYGPIELTHTNTLISHAALDALLNTVATPEHRLWACTQHFLQECGGEWTPEWLEIAKGRMEGGMILTRPWPKSADCTGCHNEEIAA